MSESLFRKAMAKLAPARGRVATDPLTDTLGAFEFALGFAVEPDAALFKEVSMDSLDLVEVTIALDEVYGEQEWEPLWKAAGIRQATGQEPILTARMIADYLGENHRASSTYSAVRH